MSIGWIISLIWKILGLFQGDGTRLKFEARSEKSIKAERKRLDKLHARIESIKHELKETVNKIIHAQKKNDSAAVDKLNFKRQHLLSQLRTARDDYKRAQGQADEGR